MTGIGSHQSARMKNDEWLTPPHVLQALGTFNLDPCAPINRPWEMAEQHYTVHDNGLQKPWNGRVWLNPSIPRPVGQHRRRLGSKPMGLGDRLQAHRQAVSLNLNIHTLRLVRGSFWREK